MIAPCKRSVARGKKQFPSSPQPRSGLNSYLRSSRLGCDVFIPALHISVLEYSININMLAEKMLFMLQHPEKRKRMGEIARIRYKELYTSEIMGRKMMELYEKMYNPKSGNVL